ncbi:MAG: twin-arginine translocase subunit TatC [Chloroflexi bacterium]|nr:twin-arginine translocase subunit TatC [Chloroflexota bacterium]MCY4247791.1 twin-arginine translocase subunit TatC [Chloroflexota bacterium]
MTDVSELPEVEEGHELRMGFFEHLDELRHRLTRAAFSLVVGTAVGVFLGETILRLLLQPYRDIVADSELVILDPTGNIFIYFKVALMVGGILSIPMVTYQLLMFILPGLTRKERRYVLLSLPATTALFIIGVFFAWRILMPPALGFLHDFQGEIFEPEWTADGYISFVTSLLFWMGAAFQTPLIFFVISLLGLVSAGTLVRQWRIAVVGASIAAALITPTIDPVNMFLVMAPLLALYALSIVLVYFGRKLSGIDRAN